MKTVFVFVRHAGQLLQLMNKSIDTITAKMNMFNCK